MVMPSSSDHHKDGKSQHDTHPYTDKHPSNLQHLAAHKSPPQERVISLVERLFYGLLTGVIFCLTGVLLDVLIHLIYSNPHHPQSQIFWIFTPLLLVAGAFAGAFVANLSAIALFYKIGQQNTLSKDFSIRHDVFRVLGIGLILLVLIYLLLVVSM